MTAKTPSPGTPEIRRVSDTLHDTAEFEDADSVEEESDTEDALEERYQDLGEIGRGGMGSIHRVEDANLLRQVAMKILEPSLARSPMHIQAFLEEAQITAQLDHPNVVPIHELGIYQGHTYYFTMKLVEGQTLSRRVRACKGTLRTPSVLHELLSIFLKVCDAIAFAHSRGVLHCDLKPSNVMVGHYGEVYVMDWGLSRLFSHGGGPPVDAPRPVRLLGLAPRSLVQSGISGTPAYMSPEQALGEELTEQTDVFGLGAILYYILLCEAPFDADTVEESMRRAARVELSPLDPETSGLTVPPGLYRIVTRAMARRPADRYASVLELKREVERFLRGGFYLATRVFAAGEPLMVEGEAGNAAYLIVRGSCVAYKTIDGVRRELRRMGPGSVVGEMALLLSQPRTATVEALEELHAFEVTREMLEEGLGIDTWIGRLVVTLAERFRDLDEQLTQLRRSLNDPRG
ncbi:MAG TPA: protein kinase [Polyangia bacterium]|jgi:serine/threonine-protein kinase|nr:protein kinase [Polyangia bacterium]